MRRLYIAMYHYVRDLIHSRYPSINGLDVSLFRHQIEFMKKNFHIIMMEELIDAIYENYDIKDNSLLLTFDDGYIDHYEFVMPILEEYGIQGSFFIPGKTFVEHKLLDVNKIHYILASEKISNIVNDLRKMMDRYRGSEFSYSSFDDFYEKYAVASRFDDKNVIFIKRMLQTVLPEKVRNMISSDMFLKYVGISEENFAYELYLNEDQIMTMKRHGMFIGIHGYDHHWLGNIDHNKMENDILMSLNALDQFIDKRKWVMNFPYGNYNNDIISYIKANGACIGLTTEVRIADIANDNPFSLPRLDCNDFPPKSDNYKTLCHV